MDNMKEVRFDEYCSKCKYWEKTEADDPCFYCLDLGWNTNSHKPIYFEEDEKKTSHSKQVS